MVYRKRKKLFTILHLFTWIGQKEMSEKEGMNTSSYDLAHAEEEFQQSGSSLNKDFDIVNNDPPPEGGLKAWLVVLAASSIMTMSFGMCNSYGVYQTYYEQKYINVNSNVLSIIGALQAGLTFWGALPSTIGMYYVGAQTMVWIGGLLSCLSFMFLSISNNVWQIFIIQGLMFGLGSGTMYVHSTATTFQYFNRKKALVQGIITASASLGGVYWPIAIRELIDKVGFGWANRIIGFIYIPLVLVAVVLLRPRVKPKKRLSHENFLRINFKVLINWRFIIVYLAFLIFMLSLFPGMYYIDLFCVRASVDKQFQLYSVAIINACACFFRVLPGFIADKVGRINIIIPSLLLSGIFPLAIWIRAKDTPTTVAFVVLWACSTAVPVAIFPPIIGQLFDGPDIYSYLSLLFVFGGLGTFLGPIIGGTFIPKGDIQTTQGFDNLAIFCGVLSLVSTGLMIGLRLIYSNSWKAKI